MTTPTPMSTSRSSASQMLLFKAGFQHELRGCLYWTTHGDVSVVACLLSLLTLTSELRRIATGTILDYRRVLTYR